MSNKRIIISLSVVEGIPDADIMAMKDLLQQELSKHVLFSQCFAAVIDQEIPKTEEPASATAVTVEEEKFCDCIEELPARRPKLRPQRVGTTFGPKSVIDDGHVMFMFPSYPKLGSRIPPRSPLCQATYPEAADLTSSSEGTIMDRDDTIDIIIDTQPAAPVVSERKKAPVCWAMASAKAATFAPIPPKRKDAFLSPPHDVSLMSPMNALPLPIVTVTTGIKRPWGCPAPAEEPAEKREFIGTVSVIEELPAPKQRKSFSRRLGALIRRLVVF